MLPSQISKVRSVDLDDWTDEQLQCIKEGGNKRGRQLWEPADPPPEMRTDEYAGTPHSLLSPSAYHVYPIFSRIAELIKMKYVDRRWVV